MFEKEMIDNVREALHAAAQEPNGITVRRVAEIAGLLAYEFEVKEVLDGWVGNGLQQINDFYVMED